MQNHLKQRFEIQRATNEEVIHFLSQEWGPQLLIVDGDSVLFNAVSKLRSRLPFDKMGLILVTKELSPLREERCFKAGCDHVINYPQSGDAFLSRLEILLRRMAISLSGQQESTQESAPIEFGSIQILPRDHIIRRGDLVITMTPIQFKLLLAFLNNRDRLLTRAWLKENVWGALDISLRSIDAQVSKLRKIVPELDPHLVNIYGKGYVLTEGRKQAA